MSQASSSKLKRTSLFAVHKSLGAKMVPFAGWEMPIQYAGVMQEHLCVRDRVGIFDVSHMGEIEIKGKDAKALLQWLLTNDIEKMTDGSILYSLMCYANGGIVDDLLVHRLSENHYFLCVNASNTEKDFQWILDQAGSYEADIQNTSPKTAQLALQGRQAQTLLNPLCDINLEDLEYYHFKKGKIQHNDCIISRTGYTGEDGFEIYTEWEAGAPIFTSILEIGEPFGIQPVGLAARDTLRLEMGYALYGNDIDASTLPHEAGLGWVVKLNKGDFMGKAAIAEEKINGPKRKRVGIELNERGVPRPHYPLMVEDRQIGELTSGTHSPSLGKGIGMGYVPAEYAKPGTPLKVGIRKQNVLAKVTALPFFPSRVKK